MRHALTMVMAVFLAGCAQAPGGIGGRVPSDRSGAPTEPTQPVAVGTGDLTLRVLVVDDALRPIAGALVSINATGKSGTTGSDGIAFFTHVEPGVYLIGVNRSGYLPVRAAVTLGPEEESKPFAVVLSADHAAGAYVQVTKDDFYFYAAYKVGADGAPSPGAVSVIDAQHLDLPDGLPSWLQSEAFWEPRQPLASTLQISFRVCAGEVVGICQDINGTSGGSPVYVGTPGQALKDIGYAQDGDVQADVHPAYPPPGGAAVFVDQTVTVITHAFYGFDPPAGWRFSSDGDPVLPGG